MNNIKMAGPWITELEKKYVNEMMDHGWENYDFVEKFEEEFANWHDRKFCLMTPCGTHAIHLILLALGIKEGDEVIVPECTWTGSVAPVTYVGAKPVFADINYDDWCLSIDSVKKNISEKTKAIIVVDLYGNMTDMRELENISIKNNLYLIEDSAEALGSKYGSVRAGKFGIAGVHSFHRTKTITSGEGGALLIDDSAVYERAKFLRDHGRSNKIPYYTLEATPKYMPSNLQASLAYAQFKRINELIDKKRYLLHLYKKNLSDISDLQFNLENEKIFNGAWATSLIFGLDYKLNNFDIIEKLNFLKIPSRPFFYPLSSLPAYEKYKTGSKDKNPNAYDISSRGITLPSHYDLTDSQVSFVCEGIKEIIK